ncbi:hypothetical protein BUALT_Bualt08G0069100 [Buddleja alternifolia]|uniref:Peptidase metallopeptidase domain-containing protein n=1 Tax=Buddleja alternifolia TaxID=168488 RepID=A0AAV6X4R0_9LAMI|nr:hypothetical protein BUALT_Bualt08G0069100 [Buddleja alternifolia]
MHTISYQFSLKLPELLMIFIMEPKVFRLLSCIFLLFLLNPFLFFSHANSPLDFLKPLIGTQKGNTARGLSQLKKYLSDLGYISNNINANNPSDENDDFFDDNLELAIKKYQRFFKLSVNGVLDANTIAKLMKPRCGVPDFPNRIQFANTSSKFSFFPGEPKWPPTKTSLAYSFTRGTRPDVNQAILDATRLWSSVSPFRFVYVPEYNNCDIKITFEFRDHGDGLPFDGPGGILAHAFAPIDGRLHYDGDEMWRDGVFKGAYDMQTIGLHELGHTLGLDHSTDDRAIMYPYFDIGSRKGLGQDDIDGIKALYKF